MVMLIAAIFLIDIKKNVNALKLRRKTGYIIYNKFI